MQIVSSIAVPRRARPPRPGRAPKYPWAGMEVGDSFFVRGLSVQSISSAAVHYAKAHGTLYTCRATPTGVRVLRIK